MSYRAIWKGPFVDPKLLKQINNMISRNKFYTIKTWSRKSVILPHFVGLKFLIHNGRKFFSLFINERMIGKKFGEFVFTRTFAGHQISKKAS